MVNWGRCLLVDFMYGQKFGVNKIYKKKNITTLLLFILQGHIKLIKSYNKALYDLTNDFYIK